AAGDQSVEQDGAAVGELPQGAGEVRAGGRVGAGPGTGHGVLVDAPAEAGQVEADPAVVGIASAGRRRVVDAARHHEVDHAQGHGDDPVVPRKGRLPGNVTASGGAGPFGGGGGGGRGGVTGRVGHSARS